MQIFHKTLALLESIDSNKGKGTIVKFSTLPCLQAIRMVIKEQFEINELLAEGNLYYDIKKTGIGYHKRKAFQKCSKNIYHGDTERSFVIGLRLGESMNLCY